MGKLRLCGAPGELALQLAHRRRYWARWTFPRLQPRGLPLLVLGPLACVTFAGYLEWPALGQTAVASVSRVPGGLPFTCPSNCLDIV